MLRGLTYIVMIKFNLSDKILLTIPEHLRPFAEETFERYNINTTFRACHFLAQLMHESNDFKCKEEKLNYSADGLMKTFSGYFPTKSIAITYARNPSAIASKVYANRYGNRDESSHDGWTYRGRGFIQITFRANYEVCGKALGLDLVNNPTLLLEDRNAMLSAGWYWDIRKINLVADKGFTNDVIKEVTRKINPGLLGLKEREEKLNQICNKL